MESNEKVVLHEEDVRRALTRIAHEIVERNPSAVPALVGIHTRGAFIARRLHGLLEELLEARVPIGDLDIGFYRDDVSTRPEAPVLHASHIDFDVRGLTVVIVDDVLYTGRTVRAAIEALFDYGRPERVQLAVLADRGHRELPIRPDYVGKNLPTSRDEHVHVRLLEARRGRRGRDRQRRAAGGRRGVIAILRKERYSGCLAHRPVAGSASR